MIPLGLYRTEQVNLSNLQKDKGPAGLEQKQKENMRKIKYVVTNPPRNDKVEPGDIVFVLAQKDPKAAGKTGQGEDDLEDEAQIFNADQ